MLDPQNTLWVVDIFVLPNVVILLGIDSESVNEVELFTQSQWIDNTVKLLLNALQFAVHQQVQEYFHSEEL